MTVASNRIALTLKNELAEIEPLSRIVEAMGQKHGASAEALYAVNLALDEILTNVISHGYADRDEHQIRVRLHIDTREFIAEIEDDGRPFNPMETPPPNLGASLPEKPIGGLGIHLAKTMMDSMAYRRESEKNILTIRKKIAIDQRC